ncbi:MAG TPA: caspase family protein [Chryseolinea sp.]|nr:caspase family protein [Chryseolinea sp.]
MTRYVYVVLFALVSFELCGQAGWSTDKEVNIAKSAAPTGPANLEISDVAFSDVDGNSNSVLDANEKAEISFTLSNLGKGNAHALAADLIPLNQIKGIALLFKKQLGDLFAGKSMRIALPIRGVPFLETGKAELEIHVQEANGFDSNPIRVSFNTQRVKIPEISIADYRFTGNDGEAIGLGHPISLTVLVQNKGQGEAIDIRTEFTTPEKVFPAAESSFYIDRLKPNEGASIVFEFFANKKYDREEIPIEISITDGHGKFEQIHTLNMQIGESSITPPPITIAPKSEEPIVIEKIVFRSDVDAGIPTTGKIVKNRFALIIGNEDYGKFQTGLQSDQNVLFARNDALMFKEYAVNTLGVMEKHTFTLTDATRGQMSREIERITELAKLTPNAEIIFYYAGHGLPDFETFESYLVPVDVAASNLDAAIKLKDLYAKLASSKASKIMVFLDACFSGGGRGENGLLSARTVKIRPKSEIVGGNIVAFTASSDKEVSLPFEAQSHGLFTYYLLKTLQETQGNLTLDELAQHLEQEIPEASLLENGLLQRPQVLVSPDLDEKWMTWKF